jgi:RNA polymerase sigma-70 factor (ECF subfamily)
VDEKQTLELFLHTRTEESFCALFAALYGRVRRYFLLRGLDRMTAEELSQNVLLTVYRRAGELRERELFQGWLFKVARNEMLQHLRRQPPPDWMIDFDSLGDQFVNGLAARMPKMPGDGAGQLAEWLAYLEPDERELMRLRFVEELSYEELALAFDTPLGTIKWRLFNARKKLARVISRADAGGAFRNSRKI